ncbi:MAG TPA: hypothetical protein VNJ08_07280 [Bacteriovoracaceae bacterium]|nr:hypothetical protein [Bacteriovoracaceae bacterium]
MKPNIALWSEFTPYIDLILKLDALKANGCALYLAVHFSQYHDENLYKLLKLCQEKGIEVRPWLLLEKRDGYWPNKWNLPIFTKFVSDFHEKCNRFGIKLEWIILDLEPHIILMLELERLLQAKKWFGARKLISTWGNKISWNESRKQMKEFLDCTHALGVKVQVVTMPMVIDDITARKHKLQHHLGIPVEGFDWDEVTFMLYRPYFWDYLPAISSQIVSNYLKDARKIFGDATSVALGPIGSPGMTQSKHFYRYPSELSPDIQSALNCGVNRISLFSLEGIEEQGDLNAFLNYEGQVGKQDFDFRACLLRKAVRLGIGFLPPVL